MRLWHRHLPLRGTLAPTSARLLATPGPHHGGDGSGRRDVQTCRSDVSRARPSAGDVRPNSTRHRAATCLSPCRHPPPPAARLRDSRVTPSAARRPPSRLASHPNRRPPPAFATLESPRPPARLRDSRVTSPASASHRVTARRKTSDQRVRPGYVAPPSQGVTPSQAG